MELSLAIRRQVTARLVKKYQKASKAEKSALLDQLCAVNGWHRDHARKALRRAAAGPPAPRKAREPLVRFGPEVIDALRFCWAVLDGPCGKRLSAGLPRLVASLRAHGELVIDDATAVQLCAMSAATIDRRLAADRGQLQVKGTTLTRPGSMLKSKIPMKTWAEWDDTRPGFVEIDLVGHDGGDNNDVFCYTLCVTDVATGWTCARTVRSKGERIVAAALQDIQVELPFALLGIHSDNGSEFINRHLLRWTQTMQITFTRGRPHRSNDNAHVEQKNYTIVRHGAGYFRYDTPREQELLNRLWTHQTQLTNLFVPQQKLVSKTRTGAKVRKRYDKPTTPADRLLGDHFDVLCDPDRVAILTALDTVNPAALRRSIGDLQNRLVHLANQRGPVPNRSKRYHIYESRRKIDPPPPPRKRASSDESTTKPKRAS
jgi:transposase InsO family protein